MMNYPYLSWWNVIYLRDLKNYIIYTMPLDDVIRTHGLCNHFYTKDTQLFLLFKPKDDIVQPLTHIETCLKKFESIISPVKSVTPPQLYCSAFSGTPHRCDGVSARFDCVSWYFGLSEMFCRYLSSLCLKLVTEHPVWPRIFTGRLLKSCGPLRWPYLVDVYDFIPTFGAIPARIFAGVYNSVSFYPPLLRLPLEGW